MSQHLAERAAELVGVVHGIRTSLAHTGTDYATDMAKALGPYLASFEHAVFVSADRDAAKAAVSAIDRLMSEINAADTKGEMALFPAASNIANHYWALHTIFREKRYSGQQLAFLHDDQP